MKGNNDITLNRQQRIYAIHNLIMSGMKPKAQYIASRLRCSITTVYNDIAYLGGPEKDPLTGQRTGYGAPVSSEPKVGGYFYNRPWRFPFEDEMLGNNLQILSSSKLLLSYFENTPFYEEIEKTLDNICRLVPDSPLLKHIALAPDTKTTQKINPVIWKIICGAITDCHVVRFRYQNNSWDPDLEEEALSVRPYQLLLDDGRSFLFGYLEDRNDVRLYNLNKIYELRETSSEFEMPEDFEFRRHSGSSNFGAFTRYAPRRYRIAFYEDAINDVKAGNWAEDQVIEEDPENGRIIISFTSSQDMKILDWVFQNKAYAEPLEPESLVLRWKFNIAVMAQMAGFDVKVDYDLLYRAEELEKEGL